MTTVIKRNDIIKLTATLQRNGVAVNVTSATVKFNMYNANNLVAKITSGTGAVETGASGIVSYTFTAANTDTEGNYFAEFEITYADTTKETFPNTGYLQIKIEKDLNDA